MKKLIFNHVANIKHSGHGSQAIHTVVMDKFRESIEEGKRYCQLRGWEVSISDGILTVRSKAPFGFGMTALVQEVE